MKSYKWFCVVYTALIDYCTYVYAWENKQAIDFVNSITHEFMNACRKQHGKFPKMIERKF